MGLEIIQINKDKAYDEWLQFRSRGLGASEIGTLMGVNSWKSPAELYYQKIGLIPQKVDPNIPMFMGTILEKTVAEIFEYWDGDDESMLRNHEAGTKVRNLYEPVGYVVNPDYPHLFFSPDRLQITSKNLRIRNGRINLENVEAWKMWKLLLRLRQLAAGAVSNGLVACHRLITYSYKRILWVLTLIPAILLLLKMAEI